MLLSDGISRTGISSFGYLWLAVYLLSVSVIGIVIFLFHFVNYILHFVNYHSVPIDHQSVFVHNLIIML